VQAPAAQSMRLAPRRSGTESRSGVAHGMSSRRTESARPTGSRRCAGCQRAVSARSPLAARRARRQCSAVRRHPPDGRSTARPSGPTARCCSRRCGTSAPADRCTRAHAWPPGSAPTLPAARPGPWVRRGRHARRHPGRRPAPTADPPRGGPGTHPPPVPAACGSAAPSSAAAGVRAPRVGRPAIRRSTGWWSPCGAPGHPAPGAWGCGCRWRAGWCWSSARHVCPLPANAVRHY